MKKLLLCIVTLAAFACTSGVALGGKTYSAEAFIQYSNGTCGGNVPHDPVIGVVTYHRTGNEVRFAIDMEHGAREAPYSALLYKENSPGSCQLILFAEEAFTTNNRGEGHFTGEVEVEEDATMFSAGAFGEAGGGDTPAVTLP